MSRTLFWYVFRDLLRIFFLTSGALAGIMSFGGLLRPLTQNGLDAAQVLLLLRYSMPAMSTYSLPVAALFATTSVYGRMSADNELTACRASGISFLSMTTPAMLLGLGVALGSMFLLCFTVPAATMKIEQVLVSNLAQIVAHQIEQTHEVQIPPYTIFAQEAYLPPQDPKKPDDAAVVLRGPMIVSYYAPRPVDPFFLAPRQFYLAKQATAYIHEDPANSSATLRATLVGGVVLPRRFTGVKSEQGGLSTAEFGPEEIPSPLQQKAKFMSILQLKQLEKDPYHSQQVQKVTAEFIEDDQAIAYAQTLLNDLNGPQHCCVFNSAGETYTLTLPPAATATLQRSTITLVSPKGAASVRLVETTGSQGRLVATTQLLKLGITADTPNDRLVVAIDLDNALVDVGDGPTPQAHPSRHFTLPMPPAISALQTRTAQQYLHENTLRTPAARARLLFAVVDLINHLRAEMHSRAAFVVSCLLLVLVGTALGMMFKSGNFLTAFAVSVVPAMFSIILIVSGQHVAQATPIFDTLAHNPLNTGLAIIWASNVLVGVTALVLLVRLQRQ